MREVVSRHIPQTPKAIVIFTAHWESDPVGITSSSKPTMLFDYEGFPPESYEYKYDAPGSPELAGRIHKLLSDAGVESKLEPERGYDQGVFVPLLIMYPDADIPVVSVSLHGSLDAAKNIRIGQALEPLRDEGVLMIGSGYTFHNVTAIFNPTDTTLKASGEFNEWLKAKMTKTGDEMLDSIRSWESAPGARVAQPREDHLLPLFITAAAAGPLAAGKLIFDQDASNSDHAVSGYLFE